MLNNNHIQSIIELDDVSSAILNAMTAQAAIVNNSGEVTAFNSNWKQAGQELKNRWSHPYLRESILKSLKTPLTEGNDFALRLFLGIKEVLNQDRGSFETKIMNFSDSQKKWYRVAVNSLGEKRGAVLIYEDITDHVHRTNYIREARERFENQFNNDLFGILISDENQVIIDANNVACSIIGLSRKEIIYSDIRNFVGSGIEIDASKIQKRINQSGNFLGERTLKAAGNKDVPVEMSVHLIRNSNGENISSWAFKDISAQKEAEKALRFSELQYKLQFNNTLVGTIIGRPDGDVLAVNPAACKILGYTEDELKGHQQSLFFDIESPENIQALQKRREEGSFTGELEVIHKNGTPIPVEVSTTIYDGEDGTERTILNFMDISSKKVIQEQLMQEKDFTELAISTLPTAFFVFSVKGEMVRWNSILEQELEYTADEIAEINVMDLVHPDDQYKLKDVLKRKLHGKKLSIEARCITKTGNILHYIIRGTSFQQNGTSYIVGGGLNRNDFKEAEIERRRNSELLDQLFYNSPIGIVLVDADGNIRNANQSFENMFGYKGYEITGKSINTLIVPEGMGEEGDYFSQKSMEGDTFQKEAVRIRKDGTKLPVLVGGIPVEFEGKVIAIYGMYVDISERKKLEDRIVELLKNEQTARLQLEDMFDEAPSAIALMEGPEHTYTYANEKYKDLVEKNSLVGKANNTILPELSDQGFTEILDSCYSTGESVQYNERKVYFEKHGDRSQVTRYLNFVFKPLRHDNQEIYGVLVEAIDVSEQVQARHIIEKSLAEKNTLLGEVHHRVKNNLAIISGLLELELMSTENNEVNKLLNSTQSRISSIAKIHELLYQNESLSHINFKDYINKVLNLEFQKPDQLVGTFELDDVVLNVNQAIPAGILLNEIFAKISEICTNHYDGLPCCTLGISLSQTENCVKIILKEEANSVIKYLESNDAAKTLRDELIEVLLRQVRGNLVLDTDEGIATISFAKREAKGPHNSLKK